MGWVAHVILESAVPDLSFFSFVFRDLVGLGGVVGVGQGDLDLGLPINIICSD